MRGALTTVVTHHPGRPAECLLRTLESLRKATGRPHSVELVVQGPGAVLPPASAFQADFDLVVVENDDNLGNGVARRDAVVRFLEGDHQWLARLDDDVTVPRGAWDSLLAALSSADGRFGVRVGCAMAASTVIRPQLLDVVEREGGRYLYRVGRSLGAHTLEDGTCYDVCDFVGHGVTLFSREVWSAGCSPDPAYFVGGVDIDVAIQMLRRGLHSVLCDPPQCEHRRAECTPPAYRAMRWSHDEIHRSGDHFKAKWGFEDELLLHFGDADAIRAIRKRYLEHETQSGSGIVASRKVS